LRSLSPRQLGERASSLERKQEGQGGARQDGGTSCLQASMKVPDTKYVPHGAYWIAIRAIVSGVAPPRGLPLIVRGGIGVPGRAPPGRTFVNLRMGPEKVVNTDKAG